MIATSGIYKFLLLCHLLAVIIGFGPVMIAGAYAAKAKKRGGIGGLAIAESLFEVNSTIVEWVIYSVPIFGILLVLASDDAWKFSQAWVSAALGLYIVALAIVHAVHLPNLRRLNGLMAEAVARPAGGGPPPQLAEMEMRGKRAAMVGGVLNLFIVVIVILMIWKPGAHV